MEHGKNTVGIYYKIKNGKQKSKLTLTPIINFRDFHTLNTNHEFVLKKEIRGNKVKIIVDDNSTTPIYINLSEGKFIRRKKRFFCI